MQCCRHGTIILDADQEVPPYVDEVFFKWRFYHRAWRAADTQLVSLVWYISASNRSIEYDAVAAALRCPRQAARNRRGEIPGLS